MMNPVRSMQYAVSSNPVPDRSDAYCLLPSAYSPRGFTLVETLVAITLVTVAMLGPFQVVQKALAASYAARDQLIASSLAEEAIEYVRSVRDRNYLYNVNHASSPRSWFYSMDGTGNDGNCLAPRGCIVDPTQNSISQCGTFNGKPLCPALNLSGTHIYTQANPSGSKPTRFTRYVTLTSVSATEMTVTVTVTWETGRVPYTVTVVDTLHNWL
ncbi:MAG TPA: prepilin-type N-terminal cleavage/methylation domain-containing protein [Candidatus Paceibacterota bacterium]|nr:prepilin-type N-terminal cleavage/methylation domain-containing protein [Candidatus Paceibacterota bacterium]